MRGVRIALAIGLALTMVALVLTLSGTPVTIAPRDTGLVEAELASAQHNSGLCQSGETVPAGTTAIRLSLKALIGPKVDVHVFAGGHVLTFGEREDGWTAATVTVPVKRVAHTVAHAKVCVAFAVKDETVVMAGTPTPRSRAAVAGGGQVLPGRLNIEYLLPGHSSWWSLALPVARHMGLGRAWAGTWVVLLVLVLMGVVLVLTVWRVLGLMRAVRGRVPRVALACVLVACLNAVAWSFITPPFQVTDETDHFAYVQQLVATGLPPTSSREEYSRSEQVALVGLRQFAVRLQPENHTIFAQAEQRELQDAMVRSERLNQRPTGAAGLATGEPPLYYALQTIPYTLAGGTVLDRLAVMRLFSALLAGITALFVFLFVRETLPSVAWAWTVGGLAVALAPLLGFVSGGVNPDTMLFAVSAALFYCLARAFRRGLTPRLALTIGGVAGIGLVTKLNFIGLLPGVLIGLAVLALRASRRSSRTRAISSLILALATIAIPVLATIVVDTLAHRPLLGPAVGVATSDLGHHGTLLGEIAYLWQLYLPRLPDMANDFHNGFAPKEIWFDGYVGLYGWLDTTFPAWVYTVALVPAVLLGGFCARALFAGRAALRGRLGEFAVYVAIAVGLLGVIGLRSYSEFPAFGASYGEARYLLPLLPLLGVLLALAARGAGRRWGPVLGTLIVVLAFAHDIFSQLQVVARYYY
jgi:4-amino-4-deoxy-L-arabinose transferase-like glycosyltransferase